jgi:hypothetical protein
LIRRFCPKPKARDFAIADLNRDGHPDLVLAGDAGTIVPGTGTLRFAFDRALKLPVQHARSCDAADLDGNGEPNVLFVNDNGGETYDLQLYVYWNSPDGFSATRRKELPSSGATSAAIGDADDDPPGRAHPQRHGGPSAAHPTYIYFGSAKGEY